MSNIRSLSWYRDNKGKTLEPSDSNDVTDTPARDNPVVGMSIARNQMNAARVAQERRKANESIVRELLASKKRKK